MDIVFAGATKIVSSLWYKFVDANLFFASNHATKSCHNISTVVLFVLGG